IAFETECGRELSRSVEPDLNVDVLFCGQLLRQLLVDAEEAAARAVARVEAVLKTDLSEIASVHNDHRIADAEVSTCLLELVFPPVLTDVVLTPRDPRHRRDSNLAVEYNRRRIAGPVEHRQTKLALLCGDLPGNLPVEGLLRSAARRIQRDDRLPRRAAVG